MSIVQLEKIDSLFYVISNSLLRGPAVNTQGVAVEITRLQESKVCQDLPTPTPLIINLENTHRQPLPARHSPPPYTGFSPPLHFIPVRKSAASAFLSTLPSLPLSHPSSPHLRLTPLRSRALALPTSLLWVWTPRSERVGRTFLKFCMRYSEKRQSKRARREVFLKVY